MTTSFLWLNWLRLVRFLSSQDGISVVCYSCMLQLVSILQMASCEMAVSELNAEVAKFSLKWQAIFYPSIPRTPDFDPKRCECLKVHKYICFNAQPITWKGISSNMNKKLYVEEDSVKYVTIYSETLTVLEYRWWQNNQMWPSANTNLLYGRIKSLWLLRNWIVKMAFRNVAKTCICNYL